MHGIERARDVRGVQMMGGAVRRIQVRYHDGRTVTFVPDMEREFFSEDDLLELKKVLDRASSAAEWAEIMNRSESV